MTVLLVMSACSQSREVRDKGESPRMTEQSISIDTSGWTPDGQNRWRNSRGGELQLITSSAATEETADITQFRERARNEILSRGGGLVSADLSPKGIGVVIAKYPQQPSGMTYEGVLVFAKNRTGHRAIVTFKETGTTGLRDAVVFDRHLAGVPDDVDPLEGWMRDPYDASRKDPLMRNGADDEQHDGQFPDHPLTLVRAEVARLQRSL